MVKKVPGVSGKIDEENRKVVEKLKESLRMKDDPMVMPSIPAEGVSEERLLEIFGQFAQNESVLWKDGKLSGKVYNGTDKVNSVRKRTPSIQLC